jgi:hypothetical protein
LTPVSFFAASLAGSGREGGAESFGASLYTEDCGLAETVELPSEP